MRDLRARDPEKHREYARKYRAAHVEKYRDATRRWQAAHRKKTRDYARQRYAANPEKFRQIARDRRAVNPENHREAMRKYRAVPANRQKERERARKFHAAHPEKQRERDRKRHQRERDILRAARQAAKPRKRGRQPGPDKPTTARRLKRQERIILTAAFLKLKKWSENAMSSFVFKDTPRSAYSNLRNFISDYRLQIEEAKEAMTLTDAERLVTATGAYDQAV